MMEAYLTIILNFFVCFFFFFVFFFVISFICSFFFFLSSSLLFFFCLFVGNSFQTVGPKGLMFSGFDGGSPWGGGYKEVW